MSKRRPVTNRHGIPVYDFAAPSNQCCVPHCGANMSLYPELHLCNRHAEQVHERLSADYAVIEEAERERRAAAEARDKAAREARAARLDERWPRRVPAPHVPVQREPEPVPDPVIYYVRNGGHIKVGWTRNLTKRMRDYPPGCELLAVHPGTYKEELALHRRFKVHLSHGREWYPLVPVLLEHIKRMVEEHGKPDAVDFGAKPVVVPMPYRQQHMRVKGYLPGTGTVRG